MSQTTRNIIEHISVTTNQPYDNVVAAFDARLGPAREWAAIIGQLLGAHASWQQVEETITAQIGESGLALFFAVDHTPLLALAGKTSRAKQYAIGNPLLAVQMTRYVPEAALYAPLRLVVYENEGGQAIVAYDRFVSLIAQYQRPEMIDVAQEVERKLEALIAAASVANASTPG
jgi:uncharacterized protein (DUF302 family)